jgi:hypothetical protein
MAPKQKQPQGAPMDLGNMRQLGVQPPTPKLDNPTKYYVI